MDYQTLRQIIDLQKRYPEFMANPSLLLQLKQAAQLQEMLIQAKLFPFSPELQNTVERARIIFQEIHPELSLSPQLAAFFKQPVDTHFNKEDFIQKAKEITNHPHGIEIKDKKVSSPTWLRINDKEKFLSGLLYGIQLLLDEVDKTTSIQELQNLVLFINSMVFLYLFLKSIHTS